MDFTETNAIVVAQNQVERARVTEQAEVGPLYAIAFFNGLVGLARKLVHHEGIAQIDDEIRFIGQGIGQGDFVEFRHGLLVKMGIRLHREGKGTARRTLCMEGISDD